MNFDEIYGFFKQKVLRSEYEKKLIGLKRCMQVLRVEK